MVAESSSSSVCCYLLAVLPRLFTAQPLYSAARCTASTPWLSGLWLNYSLPFQLPASPPCFTASFSVIHFAAILFFFAVQPLMSAALLHLLANWPLQLCRCWPAAIASTNRFPAFTASSAWSVHLATSQHSRCQVSAARWQASSAYALQPYLLCCPPVLLAVLPHLFTAHSRCLVAGRPLSPARCSALSCPAFWSPLFLYVAVLPHLLTVHCLFTTLENCVVSSEQFLLFP